MSHKEMGITLRNQSHSSQIDQLLIHQQIEYWAQQTPDAVAVCCEQLKLTYHELNRQANQLAHYLIQQGIHSESVGSESIVGFCVDRHCNWIVVMLAVIKSGAAFLPLDPINPAQRLQKMCCNAKVSLVLTDSKYFDRFQEHDDSYQTLDLASLSAELKDQETSNPQQPLEPEHLMYVIFTSGSTGEPKGVAIEHRGFSSLTEWTKKLYQLKFSDRVSQAAAMGFDVFIWEVFTTLASGVELWIMPDEIRRESFFVQKWLLVNNITISYLPTPIAEQLLQLKWNEFNKLRLLTTAGDCLHRYKSSNLKFKLFNLYGPTENSVITTFYLVPTQNQTKEESLPPIGVSLPKTQTYVLNPQLQPTALNEVGELYIGGIGLARGYLHQPQLTTERFVNIPHIAGEQRLYKTGDLVRRLSDGNLAFVGRVDHQVKLRGIRIELGEIEAILCQHELVKQAVVLCKRSNPQQASSAFLVAYWVPSTTNDLEAVAVIQELRAWLQQRLPTVMVPTVFHVIKQLPLTGNGKVDRNALPNLAVIKAHQPICGQPTTELEQQLCALWSELLPVSVGIHNNFFECGGHSLLITNLGIAIWKQWQINLSFSQLMAHPTVYQLATLLQRALDQQVDPQEGQPRFICYDQPVSQVPMVAMQQQIWTSSLKNPESSIYNESMLIDLNTSISPVIVEQALKIICERHDILRSSLHVDDTQQLKLHICPQVNFVLEQKDLTYAIDLQHKILTDYVQQPFDITQAPLFRALLITTLTSDSKHKTQQLLIVAHHSICDGLSIYLWLKELWLLCHNQAHQLPSLHAQFSDYARWSDLLQNYQKQNNSCYWQQQLQDLVPLQVPRLFSVALPKPEQGAQFKFHWDQEFTQQLQQFSQQRGITLFITLLAGFYTVLFRYTSQKDLVIGSIQSDRSQQSLQNLLGCFLNTLALRIQLSDHPTVEELLQVVEQSVLEAYAHPLPFMECVRMSQDTQKKNALQSLTDNPLFQVAFVMQPKVDYKTLQPWSLAKHQIHPKVSKFNLTLAMEQMVDGLTGTIEYRTDYWDEAWIQRLSGHLYNLLQDMMQQPQQKLSHLTLLTQAEKEQLEAWSYHPKDYPSDQSIVDMIEQQAKLQPQALAVKQCDHSCSLTYQQLNEQANQLAHHLRYLGAATEVRIAVCMERTVTMIVALLAVLKSGAAFLPINANHPKERLHYILSDASVAIVISDSQLKEQFNDFAGQIVYCDEVAWSDYPKHNLNLSTAPDQLAYIIYTSGSTGKPKGVAIEHHSLLNLIHWFHDEFQLTNKDIGSQIATISFDAMIWEVWPILTKGAQLLVVDDQSRLSPTSIQNICCIERVTIVFLPTNLGESFVQLNWASSTSLRLLSIAGEKLNSYPDIRLPFRIANLYGPTENTVAASCYWLDQGDKNTFLSPPIGQPIANVRIDILDGERQLVPIGIPGQLIISGNSLMRGYVNSLQSGKFTEAFDLDDCNRKNYRTGDFVRWSDKGLIEFIGRLDHQKKISGVRVEISEVEHCIKQFSQVKKVIVISYEDVGSKSTSLAAFIVLENGTHLIKQSLKSQLRSKLPEAIIPKELVFLSEIPLTPHGKVDLNALNLYLHSKKNDKKKSRSLTVSESKIVLIWKKILNVATVSAADDFFDLGGNSLQVARLLVEIRKAFDLQLSAKVVYENPTLEELTEIISKLMKLNNYSSVQYNWQQEAQFDLNFPRTLSRFNNFYRCVLVTGVTGFVGAFLLDKLLQRTNYKIYCIVRAEDNFSAYERLLDTFKKFQIENLFDSNRVEVICGDLSQPKMGLSHELYDMLASSIDMIYHSAAEVNFIKPYQLLKESNVSGTREILNFSSHLKLKAIQYISTLVVFGTTSYFNPEVKSILEADDIDISKPYLDIDLGYVQSKWVAEKLVISAQKKGFPISIIRPGFAICHSTTGVTHIGELWSRMIAGCVHIGAYPKLDHVKTELMTIEYLVAAIFEISQEKSSLGKCFHIAPNDQDNLTTDQLFSLVIQQGYLLEGLSYSDWIGKIRQQMETGDNCPINELFPMLSSRVYKAQSIMELYQNGPEIDCSNTVRLLRDKGISFKKIDSKVISKYLGYLVKQKYLPYLEKRMKNLSVI